MGFTRCQALASHGFPHDALVWARYLAHRLLCLSPAIENAAKDAAREAYMQAAGSQVGHDSLLSAQSDSVQTAAAGNILRLVSSAAVSNHASVATTNQNNTGLGFVGGSGTGFGFGSGRRHRQRTLINNSSPGHGASVPGSGATCATFGPNNSLRRQPAGGSSGSSSANLSASRRMATAPGQVGSLGKDCLVKINAARDYAEKVIIVIYMC
ncbi:unnamed protein product [Protopolystoma xenopodis]|uniref:Uncharacterized protein n=1 Tax=Protopolystoma xenopodis TaxID=117903 RepID=A0A3S5BZ45_9PLAT|nr:unnamed protein product [Protopolystoma xenopodis]